MTRKLYYEDAYISAFQTQLLKQHYDENKACYYCILESTAFYPEGGGQPCDLGTLNNTRVIDVQEIDGEIRHYVEEAIGDIGDDVNGVIDWDRRFDHMQQHSGQHILSAAFEELYGLKTIAFHLGKEIVTIDLQVDDLSDEQAEHVEQLANTKVVESHPIITKWIEPEEVANYPLRKELSVTDDIRLVIIEDFDYNGCGGTHPRMTSEVGLIKILKWERHRQHIRLSFICGRRILRDLDNKIKILNHAGLLLKSNEQDLPQHIERVMERNKELEQQLEETTDTLLNYEGQSLLKDGIQKYDTMLITHTYEERSIKDLQKIAQQVTQHESKAVVILISSNEEKLQFVCARGKDPKLSMKELSQHILAMINGKGGGSHEKAQGGGALSMSPDTLLKDILRIPELLPYQKEEDTIL